MIVLPTFNPTAIQLGAIHIQWYSLAYVGGLLATYFGLRKISQQHPEALTPTSLDDLIFYGTLGIILGGRLGYVLFYNFSFYLQHPFNILAIWNGGMSFHGGLLGSVIAMYYFSKRYQISFLGTLDRIVIFAPIGIGLGRIANFINQELYGRVTTVPWGMVFPSGGPLPRHPSQLYEAFLEGIVMLVVLQWLYYRRNAAQQEGLLTGTGLIMYALFRILVECLREPDPQLGFLFQYLTMGQLLCLPMLFIGSYLIYRSSKKAK